MNLKGRNAVVTGGAVRLGRAIALRLAAEQVNVCIHFCNSHQAAQSVCREIQQHGVRGESVAADFREPPSAAHRVIDFAASTLGPIDILVNNAAIFEPGTLLDTDAAHWDRHFDINLKAPFFLSQAFVRQLGEQSAGCIVNVADWRATVPVTGHLAYTISKSALVTQTKLLAQELGPAVRVNAVAPGAILPPSGMSDAQFEQRGLRNPLRKTGTVHDVCDAVIFLLNSEFITGEVLHVSGGEQLAPGPDL